MENLNYKDRSMERKYLKMRENQFLKVKNIELKDIDVKIKREIKEFFFNSFLKKKK